MTTQQLIPEHGTLKFPGPNGKTYLWRRPATKTEFADYFRMFFGYTLSPTVHPDCIHRGHSAPLDVAYSFYTGFDYRTGNRMPIGVLKATRGLAGKSTMLAGVSTMEGLEGLDGVILGGSASQSKRVHEVGTEIWDHEVTLNDRLYQSPLRHLINDPLSMETSFIYARSKRRALTASTKSARSPHPHRLRLDEVDEMDIDVFDSAMGQTMSTDDRKLTQTAISSTHQYPNGTFSEVLQRAQDKGWPVYEYCYRESLIENGGWLSWGQVENKRLEVSDRMFKIEYDLQDPSPEDRAFDSDLLSSLFDRQYGEYDGQAGEYLEFFCCSRYKEAADKLIEKGWSPKAIQSEIRPCEHHTYAMGADWAKSKDWTVIEVYRTDVLPWWRVGWIRMGRKPWPMMISEFDRISDRFYNPPAAHDATGMGGQMADDYIQVNADAVQMSGMARSKLFNEYIVAVERKELTGPFIDFSFKEHLYCTNADLFTSGQKVHPPDPVVAGSMCVRMKGYRMAPFELGGDVGDDPLDGLEQLY